MGGRSISGLVVLLVACSSADKASTGAPTGPDAGVAGANSGGASNGGAQSGAGGAAGNGGRGAGGAAPGSGGANPAAGGSPSSGGAASGGTPSSGGAPGTGGATGAPSAADLLGKVGACQGTAIKGGFGLDGTGSLSMYQCGSAVYWKADMDVDCDGIQTPPCNTDPQGQPMTSIVDAAPNGDVDPTLLPYFVIPLGKPETAWYTAYGIELGQVGAVIYKGQVQYGIFADEAGGWFIGESSYAMCQLFLGPPNGQNDPCSPIDGGIDPADVTYVTFTGASARASGTDIYDHAKHQSLGVAAAEAWLSGP